MDRAKRPENSWGRCAAAGAATAGCASRAQAHSGVRARTFRRGIHGWGPGASTIGHRMALHYSLTGTPTVTVDEPNFCVGRQTR
jgi:hypothetical protein